MNIIIMRVEKSRLFDGLSRGNTVIVGVGDAMVPEAGINASGVVVTYISRLNFDIDIALELSKFDRVIFYTYENFKENVSNVEFIQRVLGEDKCVFMFREL